MSGKMGGVDGSGWHRGAGTWSERGTSAKRAVGYNVIFCILYVIIGVINYPPYIAFLWYCMNKMKKYNNCHISFC